ncbi:hypothetical protein PP568_06870 [Mycobacteroides abscessus]|uniref:DUF222 domain-containing protein n=1 Tax=Mycobacteroides abscessus subsp. abscessus TaxID=1185650 RepID=A0AB38D375_9MYCO|nr:hypothetical protein [Mycobacteroides abscessus]MBE5419577.1 hypothetical protein [Mycobacteroides abscessus]MBE5455724.1 hypothetical protein [Mycobacteroides abscessus]MBN7463158.1 hypothetical protein [Mycobacteroides abscessus subsp. abscessus]MBN7555261.1 hypothetical protein [Mycobacteroides abscessus subsp. abscessus]MDM2404653.1 hypothetical protein [Mycobacteroides abscessus]
MDTDRVIAAHRRAGQELAREQRPSTAGVILTGLCAEAAVRRRLGVTDVATDLEAIQELLCGDTLATAAASEVGVMTTLSVIAWAGKIEEWIDDRAQELLRLQELMPTAATDPAEQHIATAAMESVAAASDAATAMIAYAGAVAVARVRIGDAWEASTDENRDAVVAEVICGDPVWATAADELGAELRRDTAAWVHERWADIEERAAVLMQLAAAG